MHRGGETHIRPTALRFGRVLRGQFSILRFSGFEEFQRVTAWTGESQQAVKNSREFRLQHNFVLVFSK